MAIWRFIWCYWKHRHSIRFGKCLGGGSEINSGLYHEVDKEFIFKTYNNENIYNDIKKFEPKEIVENQDNYEIELINLKNIYKKGSENLNWKIEDLKKFKINKTNKKNSMSNTYLRKYEDLDGKLLTNAKVQKIFEIDNILHIEVLYKKKISYLIVKMYLYVVVLPIA